MGIAFSKIGSTIKCMVSPEARRAHQAEEACRQQRITDARERVLANRRTQGQQVDELIRRVQDEVNLDELTKLERSLPKVPHHPLKVGAKTYQRKS